MTLRRCARRRDTLVIGYAGHHFRASYRWRVAGIVKSIDNLGTGVAEAPHRSIESVAVYLSSGSAWSGRRSVIGRVVRPSRPWDL